MALQTLLHLNNILSMSYNAIVNSALLISPLRRDCNADSTQLALLIFSPPLKSFQDVLNHLGKIHPLKSFELTF